ncbi:MAG: hypothetical protein ABIO78_00285 [Thermoanaerobaculia bacterium]
MPAVEWNGPDPLTSRQRIIFWLVATVCAMSRFASMAQSLWDWDEALFSLGMRDYDVTRHHPHPPGFPVYIAAAKLLRLVVASDFRALQTVNLMAGMLVFPAVYLLARELRMRFGTAVIAGALFAFLPNVWFFGGSAFSDVPSIVLVIFVAVFLFRGARSRRDYWIGTLLLALAIGIRPQNLLVGLYPGIAATLRRPLRDVLVALLIGIAVAGLSYGGAIRATGTYDGYMTSARAHADYISRIDSFRSPGRPPLWRIFDRFFLKQYQSALLSVVMSFFVVISAVGAIRSRDRRMLANFLTFAPFAIMAWLMLDRYSISRFSIGYAPMFTLFAADGIDRLSRGKTRVMAMITALIVAGIVVWTWDGFAAVRNQVSPPVRGVQAALRHLQPGRDRLVVGYSMTPFMEYFAPSFPMVRTLDDRGLPLAPAPNSWLLAEVTKTRPEGMVFQRDRGPLWKIARRHYFDVVLKRFGAEQARFASGWFEPEVSGMDQMRWMAQRSVTLLPPAAGDMLLRFLMHLPDELIGANLTVLLNGEVVETIQLDRTEIAKDYDVRPAPAGQPNRLEMAVDRTVQHERKEVGIRLRYLSWGPANRESWQQEADERPSR